MIEFSKFAMFWPKNVVKARGTSETHHICVCKFYLNVNAYKDCKLYANNDFQNLMVKDYKGLLTYNHVFTLLTGNSGTPECVYG